MIDDGFPPTRDEWLVMRDRTLLAEDRVRMVREALSWNPLKWVAMVKIIKAALKKDYPDESPKE